MMTMIEVGSRWAQFLAAVEIKGLILLPLFACAALALRKGPAAARHWAWFLGLASLLALPVVALSAPSWAVRLPSWTSSALAPAGGPQAPRDAVAREVPTSPDGPSELSGARMAGAMPPAGTPGVEPARPTRGDLGGVEAVSEASTGRSAPTSIPWGLAFLVAWTVGALLLLGRLVGSLAAARRMERETLPSPPGKVTLLSRRISRDLGIGRKVEIRIGSPGTMPVSWGWLRPVVLLPPDALDWSNRRLTAVLLHELGHVRRADCLTQVLAEIALSLHWMNPLAWIATGRLRTEREYACDDLVLRAGARASDYAGELLSLSRTLRAAPALERAVVAMARSATLSRRLRAVLDATRRRTLGRSRALGAAAAAAVLVVALAALSPVTETPAPAEGSTVAGDSFAGAAIPRVGASVIPRPTLSVARTGQAATCGMDAEGWENMSSRSNDDHRRLEWSKPGCEVEVRVDGDIGFTADFRDVARMGSDARFLIQETEGRTERSLEVTAASDGSPRYEYRVNRDVRPFDAAARSWYQGMLLQVFRRAGFMARERVASLLAEGGVPAVLRELDELGSDYVFATYAQELLDQADDLSDAQALDVVRRARARVDSDYYLASVLQAFAPRHLGSAVMLDEYLAAATDIDSDYYRSEVLRTALDRGQLSADQVAATLEAASGMESDYYVSQVLTSVVKQYALAPAVRRTYLDAVFSMDSDYYRSEVLGTLLARNDLSAGELAVVLRATGKMSSDPYVAGLLEQVASRDLSSDELRTAYFEAAAGIDSDTYRAQALGALLDEGDLSDAQVAEVVSAAKGIGSDYYKAEVLTRVARKYRVEGATREALIDAMNSIDSDYYRGQVAELLLRR